MGFFDGLFGGLFGGISSAIGSGISAKTAKDIANKQIQAEKENIAQQYQNQLGLMSAQAQTDRDQTSWNNLNSFQQMLQGYKNAGLSTSALSGAFQPAGMSSVNAPTAPKADFNPAYSSLLHSQTDNIQNAFDSVAKGFQIRNMELQNKSLEKDVNWADKLKAAEAGLKNAQAQQAHAYVQQIKTMLPVQLAQAKQTLRNTALEFKLTGKQIDLASRQLDNVAETTRSIRIDNDYRSKVNPALIRQEERKAYQLLLDNRVKEVESNLAKNFGFTANMQPMTALMSFVANGKHKLIIPSLRESVNQLFELGPSSSSSSSPAGSNGIFTPSAFVKGLASFILFGH